MTQASSERVALRKAPTRSLNWRDAVLVLALGDAVAAIAGMSLAILIWAALPTEFLPGPFLPHWVLGSVVAWVVALGFFDGYDVVAPAFWRSSLACVARSLITLLILTGVVFFLVPFLFPRGVGALAPFVVGASLVIWRRAFARVMRAASFGRRVLLLGIDDAARRVAQLFLASRSGIVYEPVAFLTGSPTPPRDVLGVDVVSDPERLWHIAEERRVDEIVVGTEEQIASIGQVALVECFLHGIAATSAVALYETLTGRVLVSSLGPTWFTQIPTDPRRPYLLLKRVVDVVVVVLVAPLAVPLSLLIALAVALAGGHPIYRQVRLGQRGVPFAIHKFRSMTADAESSGAQFAEVADTRRTPIGRILRRTHLDELPQLWDVFRGRMSLIGPRPERPEFVSRLRDQMPLYEARFLLRPGLTGWAQVRLPYASNLEDSLVKLEYDLYYVKHVGPLLDLSIALRTIGRLLGVSGR